MWVLGLVQLGLGIADAADDDEGEQEGQGQGAEQTQNGIMSLLGGFLGM